MAFASYLCFLQASIALFGFALAYFSSRGSAFIAAETYFIFLGCLAIAQLAVLRDKAFG